MGISWFGGSKRRRLASLRPQGAYAGYFARDGEPMAGRSGAADDAGLDFSGWDERLDRFDDAVALEERKRQRWWQPAYWRDRRKRWWIGRGVLAFLLAFVLVVGFLAVTTPLSKSLEPVVPPQLTILAADGTPIARNGAIIDDPVTVEKLPPHVVEAFLAIEDRRFYNHWGVDPRGIARAAVTGVGGGSTITQQLAKFTFLTPERSITRKLREMLIAFWLETWLTKDQILERYLSNAYFGDNAYGLRAASMHYFYRQPERLTTAQAAMLAGLVQAPSALRPTKHYARAEKRMRLVLGAMVAAGYLTDAEARLPAPRLDVRTRSDLPTGTYFADWALPILRNGSERGYEAQTVTTTLDARLQGLATRIVRNAGLGGAQAALVVMRPNGEVVAMVGGKDYAKSPFNRATQAKRQPGSTFKTFVWLAALKQGMEPGDLVDNTEITQGSYRPRNAGGRYSPTLTLEQAFARSSNVAAIRLYQSVGDEAVIATARELGITASLTPGDPSVALGTATTTLLELTAAYAGIAGNAFPVKPTPLPVARQGWWEWMWDGAESYPGRVEKDMQQMLRAAINGGTGRAAMLPIANFGKTGTSQDNRDALFVGWAGDLVVGVWIGNDDNTPLRGIYGGGLPARMWRDFMLQATGRVPAATKPRADPSGPVEPMDLPDPEDFQLPEGLRIEEDGVTVGTEVGGVPIDVRLGPDGLGIQPGQREPEPEPQREPEPRR
ncbi:transglycosylase domain-containing protein [Parerythrobacter aurantius]|uniref:transglycosylase domain-containing protein n=1 Tax=Parerythrobacter aurantius TaxID=3127706 RepID=UPI003248BB32